MLHCECYRKIVVFDEVKDTLTLQMDEYGNHSEKTVERITTNIDCECSEAFLLKWRIPSTSSEEVDTEDPKPKLT